ncbi:hypothetical protein ACIPEP_06300 [Curtobacterium sp. NPDC087082]
MQETFPLLIASAPVVVIAAALVLRAFARRWSGDSDRGDAS